jgi:hypothetical protein
MSKRKKDQATVDLAISNDDLMIMRVYVHTHTELAL